MRDGRESSAAGEGSRDRLRVNIVTVHPRCGGAIRIATLLADDWVRRGMDVRWLTLEDDEHFYTVRPEVEKVSLGIDRVARGDLGRAPLIGRIRRWFKAHPSNVIVSFAAVANVITVTGAMGLGVPVIVNEANNPDLRRTPLRWRMIRRVLYRRAAALVVPSEETASWGRRELGAERVRLIYNPAPRPAPASAEAPATNRLISVGRLHDQKGFDLLLAAFAACAERFPGWTLEIVGDGPLRADLEALARDLRIAGRVHFTGLVDNPAERLAGAELFVCSSRYEGFGLALVEAMAGGVPVVSFDLEGPREIVRDSIDGLLVPRGDVDALSNAMAKLMADDGLRRQMARRAVEVADRFGEDRFYEEWHRLLIEVATN